MSRLLVALVAVVLTVAAAHPAILAADRPGTGVRYRLEPPLTSGRAPIARFTASQLAVLEKLNRADLSHLSKLAQLVVPADWHDDELQYSPFPLSYPTAAGIRRAS